MEIILSLFEYYFTTYCTVSTGSVSTGEVSMVGPFSISSVGEGEHSYKYYGSVDAENTPKVGRRRIPWPNNRLTNHRVRRCAKELSKNGTSTRYVELTVNVRPWPPRTWHEREKLASSMQHYTEQRKKTCFLTWRYDGGYSSWSHCIRIL